MIKSLPSRRRPPLARAGAVSLTLGRCGRGRGHVLAAASMPWRPPLVYSNQRTPPKELFVCRTSHCNLERCLGQYSESTSIGGTSWAHNLARVSCRSVMLSLSSRVLAHGDQPEAHRAGLGHWQLDSKFRVEAASEANYESVLLYIGLHRSVVRHPMYRLKLRLGE